MPTLLERQRPSLCGLTPIQLRELLEILPSAMGKIERATLRAQVLAALKTGTSD